MNKKEIINWLLDGDVAIQYQVHRDLLGVDKPRLQKSIEKEGWGSRFLSFRHENGHWGQAFYQPKWVSTHYTLLDLKNLAISPACRPVRQTIAHVLKTEKAKDGGLRPIGVDGNSDVCINGMALNYSAYFHADEADLRSVVDFILSQQMGDGGFNCMSNRSGATHSSLHTTISVLEGILEYRNNRYTHRLAELVKAERTSIEFILQHRLFRSHHTGQVISKKMLALCYPSRWYYDILRALDYFHFARVPYDERMQDAIDVIMKKRNKDGTWNVQAHHPGQVHFHMEQAGQASRWNTLRVLRMLKYYGEHI